MAKFIPFVLLFVLSARTTDAQVVHAISFDPDGVGPRPVINVGALDWEAGNALVDEHSGVAKNILDAQDDFRMDIYYQTKLGAFVDPSGKIIEGTGLNEDFEITMVAGFGQRGIRELTGKTVRLAHNSCYANVNFMEVYFDDSPDANALEGKGYNNGKLIYDGDVNASGVFLFPRDGAKAKDFGRLPRVTAMDAFGKNDFPGVGTAIGYGRGALESVPKSVNSAFFKNNISRFLLRSELRSPFTKVDPAKLFTTRPGGAKPIEVADFGPSIELFAKGLSGMVDMQFEPDAYSTFEMAAADALKPKSVAGTLKD